MTGLKPIATMLLIGCSATGMADPRQLTFSAQGHDLDNNDNFSPDGRWLCFDTRETIGPGIEYCQSIGMVNVATGREVVLYRPEATLTGDAPAPGVGAVSFNPSAMEVVFIHGPPVGDVGWRGAYGKPNRNGARVPADGSGALSWLDYRDIARDRDTLPGAHRGGTHRHEYTRLGNRVGFTYDDFLMPEYDRTVGYMEPRADAPEGASHYFALLVPTVRKGTSKPGEIEKAWGDSWVGRDGRMRAFIGKVRDADGVSYSQSLFVADVPLDVDITTADSGSADRYPSPPEGIRIRRLTRDWAEGIVRGTVDGDRIAYYGKADDGSTQIFAVPSDGSEPPTQLTHLPYGTQAGLRWHPSGNSVLCLSNNGVVSTCAEPGPRFGRSVFLTDQGQGPARSKLAISWDGTQLAFNRPVPTTDTSGETARNYAGEDFVQIFVLPFPDADGDGIADGTD